jgi:hypothetical protein
MGAREQPPGPGVSRIAVFVDHDIMVRHFLINGILPSLQAQHDVLFVFPERHRRVTTDPATLPLKRYRALPVSNERAWRFRRLYAATVLKRMRFTADRRPLFRFWRETLGRDAFWESWFYSWSPMYGYYRRKMLARIGENDDLNRLLAAEQPDVIIHPTVLEGLFVSDLVRYGQCHGVPTVYLMNSWDNPAVKAMMLGFPDWLVVWGEHSKELAQRRLGMPRDRILNFGAAQFDVYREPPRDPPEAYRRRLGVPPGNRILLYAGSSKGLDETSHLVALERAIEAGEIGRCTVLYRPHPWRATANGEQDFFSLRWRHVVMAPDMADYYRRTRSGDDSMYLADYRDTHVTLSAVDAVVSPLSTILLEAALHGKPIAAYLPDGDMRSNSALFTMVKTAHYRVFFERVECLQTERPQDLVRDCRTLLERAGQREVAARLKRQCEYFVAASPRPYAERLAELVLEISPERPARAKSA